MNNQKKLVVAFRSFVEKVFLPSLKKTDQQLNEWNRFNQYLNNDYINYEELYQYVESITCSQVSTMPAFEKRELPPFKKRNQDPVSPNVDSPSFNASKTFGGERARMMFMKGDMDDFGDRREGGNNVNFGSGSRADERNRSFQNIPQNILPGLEKLCKVLIDNQQRIQNLLASPVSPNAKYY